MKTNSFSKKKENLLSIIKNENSNNNNKIFQTTLLIKKPRHKISLVTLTSQKSLKKNGS